MVDYSALWQTATKDATMTDPPPKWPPWEAAGYTFLGAYAVCVVFGGVIGLPAGNFHVQRAQGIAALLAAALIFFPLWRQERKHSRAVGARYGQLLTEAKSQEAQTQKH